MIKIKENNSELITLVKGNKKIQRPYIDYKTNQKMWEFRGYKVEQNDVKEEKVVQLKPKKKRKKKDERDNLETD
tara:strand:- start:1868 stop:2089 length:222 start_codon:yes stop_codon:yes gene_type:complete